MSDVPNISREAALDASRTANRLVAGYYAYLVAMHAAANPRSIDSLPPPILDGQNPMGEVKRKDGSAHSLDMRHYLDLFRGDLGLQTELIRAWAAGSLLTLGNTLKNCDLKNCDYFDRAPVLELVRHLRNGLAHGNRLAPDDRGKRQLTRFPANNRSAEVKSPIGTVFEVFPWSTGPVLFDFMGAADVIDLLMSVEVHLSKLSGAWTAE